MSVPEGKEFNTPYPVPEPPKANKKANNIDIIKITIRTVFEIFFAEALAISLSKI